MSEPQNKKSGSVSFQEENDQLTFREQRNRNQTSQNIFRQNNYEDISETTQPKQETSNLDKSAATSNQDDVLTGQDKKVINFQNIFDKLKDFTEAAIPFTNIHIEDAIFIDDFHIVTLEYIFFHNDICPNSDPKYLKLEKDKNIKQEEKTQDNENQRDTYLQKVNMFEEPHDVLKEKYSYLKSFKKHQARVSTNNQQEQEGANTLTLKEQAKIVQKKKCKFIGTDDERVIVIPMLGKYHINEFGQLLKEFEIDIHYDCNFRPSKDRTMRLQISHDRGLIVLPLQHNSKTESKKMNISMLAWDIHSFKSHKITENLKKSLNGLPKGELLDVNFIGVSEHVMVTLRLESHDNLNLTYLQYYIFNSITGTKDLEINNLKTQVIKENLQQQISTSLAEKMQKKLIATDQSHNKIRLIGILPKPKANRYDLRKQTRAQKTFQKKKTIEEEDLDLDESKDKFVDKDESSSTSSIHTDSGKSIQEISKGVIANQSLSDCVSDFELSFIFISCNVHETSEVDDSGSENKEIKKKQDSERKKYGEKIYWTKVNISIQDIINNSKGEELKYILFKAKTKFDKYTPENDEFKQIPENWFFDSKDADKKWEGKIQLSVNRTFTQFGFLNITQKLFILYNFDDESDGQSGNGQEWLQTLNLPSSNVSSVYLGRNQYTKEQLYITIRIQGEGSTTYCYLQDGKRQKITFNYDYENAIQDATRQNCTFKHQHDQVDKEFIFSSISISKDDQELLMKTNRVLETDRGTVVEQINRKTTSQYHAAMYPVFCYNIGLFKIIVQNTLGDGIQYILELNQHEAFLAFVEFRTFDDIGFDPSQISIEGNSHFVFLTFDGQNETINVNLLFVDIYHEKCEFKLFKSTKIFNISDKKDKDIIIKAIMYSTQDTKLNFDYDIKLLLQYPNHFTQIMQSEKQQDNEVKLFTKNKSDDFLDDGKEQDDHLYEKLSQAPFIIEQERGYIYYITEILGQCRIYEILPTSDQVGNHLKVFEIKSDDCFGFGLKNDVFLFIDNNKIVTQLQRGKDSRMLTEIGELNFKDKDSPNFIMDESIQCILNEKFIIQKTKIFYLFGNKPLQAGLLDMEELAVPRVEDGENEQEQIETIVKYCKGPFNFQEANEFGIIVRDDETNFFNMNIAKLPDGRFQKIINDFSKQVDLTTFLIDDKAEKELREEQYRESIDESYNYVIDEDDREYEKFTTGKGKILLKIGKKFMLFDADCEFINMIQFYNERKEEKKETKESKDKLLNQSGIKSLSNQSITSETDFLNKDLIASEELDNLFLHAMSANNKYFLFIKEVLIKKPQGSTGILQGSKSKDERSSSPSLKVTRIDGNTEQSPNRSNRSRNTPTKLRSTGSPGNIDEQNSQIDIQICNVSHKELMMPQKLVVYSLENTGKGDLRYMEISKVTEYKKMFKKAFEVDLADEPQLFNKEDQGNDCDEKREIYIEDDGTVNIIKTWTYNIASGKHNHDKDINLKIYSIKKNTKEQKGYKIESLRDDIKFENCTLDAHKRTFQNNKKLLQAQIKNELKIQKDLPKNLKSTAKIEILEWNLKVSDVKISNVTKCFLFKNKTCSHNESIFVIKCGRDIMTAKINIGSKNKPDYKPIECNFEKDVEIVQIMATSACNELQIVARDEDRRCLIIITWNIKTNCEASIVQFPIIGFTRPGQHCVKGMDEKRNYFANDNYIFDLEFNIPLQNTSNPIQYEAAGQKYRNQRKIFKDSSRSLSLGSESTLNLAYNRMDLLFWTNIVELGEKTDTITENTDLTFFNQIFDGYSLFHYFVPRPEVIEFVCKKYKFQQEQNTLTEKQRLVPLLILHPDPDGLTALDYAINTHRPKSFKCMIDLIVDVSSNFCLTKLMLKLLQLLIKQGTYSNIDFFEFAIFQPMMMQEALIVKWPEEFDEYVFASNTSLIIGKQIEKQLGNEPNGLDPKSLDLKDSDIKKQIECFRTEFDKDSGMRLVELQQIDDSQNQTFSRVIVESLDFDWIFEKKNCLTFLQILVDQAEDLEQSITSLSSLRVFVCAIVALH